MNADFDPHEIEGTAQATWAAADAYKVGEDATRPICA
jgi:leucyl-tRNA synthetase